MFSCINKYTWQTVIVYAVDPVNNKFLIDNNGEFEWVDMSDYKP